MVTSRREFLSLLGAMSLSASFSSAFANEKNNERIRVISWNAANCIGWPRTSNLAKKAALKGQMSTRCAMELDLHEPDIICISDTPNEEMISDISQILGMNYFHIPSLGNSPGAILSRFEILESQAFSVGSDQVGDSFKGHWGRALIRCHNDEPLIVYSAHLNSAPGSNVRLKEIERMLLKTQEEINSGYSMLLMGHFNHTPDSVEYEQWISAGWVDTFAKFGKGDGFTSESAIPKERIDYVMATGPIASKIVESRPLVEGAFRLNIVDRNSFALSRYIPQLAVFKMQ